MRMLKPHETDVSALISMIGVMFIFAITVGTAVLVLPPPPDSSATHDTKKH